MARIPTPEEIGLPPKYSSWRPGQFEAVESIATCPTRFDGHCMPTGSGKTGAELGAGLVSLEPGQRAVYITATKGLQKQIMDDAGDHMKIAVLMGKSNYTCGARPGWTCEDGSNGRCNFKGTERCEYSKAYFKALQARFVLLNYSCWMAVNKFGHGLGDNIAHMFLDEAHAAFDELSNAVQIQVSSHEIEDILGCVFPEAKDDLETWKKWAIPIRKIATDMANQFKSQIATSRDPKQVHIKNFNHLRNLCRKLAMLATIRPRDWIVDDWEHGFQFDVIKPSRYAESMLYLGVPRVTFLSATMTERTLHMDGVREDYQFTEYPYVFDPMNNPFIHVPTVYVDAKMDDYAMQQWCMQADRIVSTRLDRKGIFHTVSFPRRDRYKKSSDYERLIHTNYREKGDVTTHVVDKFNKARPPALLVTPSVSTGYDFADTKCRYQIIGKVPWPNFGSKLVKARLQYDPLYANHVAMQQLVQSHGRSQRNDKDWSESICIDDHVVRFLQRNKGLAPKGFLASFQQEMHVPPPTRFDR